MNTPQNACNGKVTYEFKAEWEYKIEISAFFRSFETKDSRHKLARVGGACAQMHEAAVPQVKCVSCVCVCVPMCVCKCA